MAKGNQSRLSRLSIEHMQMERGSKGVVLVKENKADMKSAEILPPEILSQGNKGALLVDNFYLNRTARRRLAAVKRKESKKNGSR